MTHNEIRNCINTLADQASVVSATFAADLQHDAEGWVVDTSDLGIAVRELERVTMVLSRLSFRMAQGRK